MAKRPLFGKLWELTGRMRGSGAVDSKGKVGSERLSGLIDLSKYKSVEELRHTIGPLMEQEQKRTWEEFQKRSRVYRRNTWLMSIVGFGSVGYLGGRLIVYLVKD